MSDKADKIVKALADVIESGDRTTGDLAVTVPPTSPKPLSNAYRDYVKGVSCAALTFL